VICIFFWPRGESSREEKSSLEQRICNLIQGVKCSISEVGALPLERFHGGRGGSPTGKEDAPGKDIDPVCVPRGSEKVKRGGC